MKIVNIEKIIKDGNYYKQLICFGIFFVVAILVFIIEVFRAPNESKLIAAIVYGGIVLIPFGFFIGMRNLCRIWRALNKIKSKKFFIVERQIIDKEVRAKKDSSNDTQLIFSETDGVWVGRKISKEIKTGDRCYVIYLEGYTEPSGIYSKRKYVLDNELLYLVRIS